MAKWSNPLAEKPLEIYWKKIQSLDEVNDGINAVMAEVVAKWKAHAPVGSGAYRDSIKIIERSKTNGRGVVGSEDPAAHLIEFGSENNPEYAPAEKTAREFGGYATGKGDDLE